MTQIWDTAGQDKYKAICKHHYRNAVGAIIVFDLTRHTTFENCAMWLEQFREEAHEKSCAIIVGNKLDIIETDPVMRRVEKREGLEWAKQNGVLYAEVSSITNKNVHDAVESLLEEIYLNVNSFNPHDVKGFGLNGNSLQTKKSGNCNNFDKCCSS